jgi:hypothetical protein
MLEREAVEEHAMKLEALEHLLHTMKPFGDRTNLIQHVLLGLLDFRVRQQPHDPSSSATPKASALGVA